MKLLGRNKGRPYANEYEDQLERVLEAVTFVPEPLGEYESFPPFDSIFQEVAWQDDYSDIIIELCKINSRVVFA